MYGIEMQQNANANVCSPPMQQNATQINTIERKQNGNFLVMTTVFNEDLILEQSGCVWLYSQLYTALLASWLVLANW